MYNVNDKKRYNELENMIKIGLSDLKDEIEKICEEEIKIEKPYKIVDFAERILDFGNQM